MVAAVHEWASIQEALRVWVRDATELEDDHVIWSFPDAPQPTHPFALLSITSGPRSLALPERRRCSQVMQDRLTVLEAGFSSYDVRIFEAMAEDDEGTPYSYEPSGGDGIAEIREGLRLALVTSGLAVSEDPESDDALLLDGVAGREHFHTEVLEGLQRETVREAMLDTVVLPRELTLRVQVETGSQLPNEHARGFVDRLDVSVGFGSVRSALAVGGVVHLRSASPNDITALVGDAHASRVAQDFFFGLTGVAAANVPWVRTAQVAGALC